MHYFEKCQLLGPSAFAPDPHRGSASEPGRWRLLSFRPPHCSPLEKILWAPLIPVITVYVETVAFSAHWYKRGRSGVLGKVQRVSSTARLLGNAELVNVGCCKLPPARVQRQPEDFLAL